MRSLFRILKKVSRPIVKVITPLVIAAAMPETLINTAIGSVVKHGTPINNKAIPFINLALSSVVSYGRTVIATGDWQSSIIPALQQGGLLAAASTGLHQTLKIPLSNMIKGKVALATGPGDKFSL